MSHRGKDVMCCQIWCPILWVCALDFTHPNANTAVNNEQTHTSGAVGIFAAVSGEQLGVQSGVQMAVGMGGTRFCVIFVCFRGCRCHGCVCMWRFFGLSHFHFRTSPKLLSLIKMNNDFPFDLYKRLVAQHPIISPRTSSSLTSVSPWLFLSCV